MSKETNLDQIEKMIDQKQYEEAIKTLEGLDPVTLRQGHYPLAMLAFCKYNLSDLDGAVVCYELAEKLAEECNESIPNTLFYMGECYFEKAEYQKALQTFFRITKKDKNAADAYFKIGRCYEAMEKFDEAVWAYHRVIEIKPEFVSILDKNNSQS